MLFAKYHFTQILCLTGQTHRHLSRSGKPLSGFSQKHPYLHRLKTDHGHEQHPTRCRHLHIQESSLSTPLRFEP
jgi:hypothetical protein